MDIEMRRGLTLAGAARVQIWAADVVGVFRLPLHLPTAAGAEAAFEGGVAFRRTTAMSGLFFDERYCRTRSWRAGVSPSEFFCRFRTTPCISLSVCEP